MGSRPPKTPVAHPFEIVHVGGLHRRADEREVRDPCRLLGAVVGLHEQLRG